MSVVLVRVSGAHTTAAMATAVERHSRALPPKGGPKSVELLTRQGSINTASSRSRRRARLNLVDWLDGLSDKGLAELHR